MWDTSRGNELRPTDRDTSFLHAAVILATVLSVTIGISLTVTGSAACAAIAYKLVLNVKAASSVRDGVLVSHTTYLRNRE